jgi:hypothetical protein
VASVSALQIKWQSVLNDADWHPIQFHSGSGREDILAQFSAGPSGSQHPLQQEHHAATVKDGANIRAGTAKPLPDTHPDSHPFWMPHF